MTFTKLIALLAVMLPTVCLTQAEDPALRKEIEAVYKKFDALVAKGDTKSIFEMVHDSFIQVDAEGKTMNKEQMKNEHKQVLESTRDAKSKCVVNVIHDHGTEVVAWITMRVDFKVKDGNKWVPVSFTGKFAETLVRTPQGWKFTHSQMLPD